MKKIAVICAAVILTFPAMGYTGSATSRWDLSIGGMVKLDVTYNTQSINQSYYIAEREAAGVNTSSRDRYGATSWGSGESRLNFLVKGPETWGAKTSAFIEFDFQSMTSNSVSKATRNSVEDYGLANLRHAYMKFEWPTFTIVAGRTWTVPGVQQSFTVLGAHEFDAFNKGIFREQIYGVWQATKTFSMTAGVMSPYDTTGWPGGTLSSGPTIDEGFQRSNWPVFFTELAYKTDVCGKIGPWMLQFAVGGMFGKDKPLEPSDFGPVGNINNQNASNTVSNPNISGVQYWNANGYATDTVNMWMLTARAYVPIIPEKAPGKLGNSLGLALAAFTGQDLRTFAGGSPFGEGAYVYNRADYRLNSSAQALTPTADFHAPVVTGGWGQLVYYLTDTVWTGFIYGQVKDSVSQARKGGVGPTFSGPNAASDGAVERQQQYIVNLFYDPNPVVRLALEYAYTTTHYQRILYAQTQTVGGVTLQAPLTNQGNNSSIRFAAQYFF